ncbi:MAG: ankyrin repeat domain-containing protein [Pseudomonadota bacterium]
MSTFDVDKFLAKMEAEDNAFEAQMKELEAQMAEAEKATPEIVRAVTEGQGSARIAALLEAGADVNAMSPYGDTALAIAFTQNDFDTVRLLIERGALTDDQAWTRSHLSVLRGAAPQTGLMDRDTAGRTPFLLACRLGDVALAADLRATTPPTGWRDTDGDGALAYGVRSGSAGMLDWLLNQGHDVNEADVFGATPLLLAVEEDKIDLARALLEAGADLTLGRNLSRANAVQRAEPRSMVAKIATSIMSKTAAFVGVDGEDVITRPGDAAHSPAMLALLAQFGAPLEDIEAEDLPAFLGADKIAPTQISAEAFRAQAGPRYGTTNPERVDIPFWREQIRTGRSGWSAENDILGDTDYSADYHPIWSFNRFGRSGTRLGDGTWVLVGGEHEDHYDPDFNIYNDVTVIHPDGRIDHYIYPSDVFPPTDFHTATLMGDHILLIGALSYNGQRPEGETQVMRLNLSDFSITRVQTRGQNPGWISRHTAHHEGQHIVLTGGKVEPGYRDNTDTYLLDTATMVWSRAQ